MRFPPIVPVFASLLAAAACSTSVTPAPAPPPASARASTAATLGIPPGHLPAPGACRLWLPGVPPGQQPVAPGSGTGGNGNGKGNGKGKGRQGAGESCDAIAASAPAGSWVVYRPGTDRKVVHVREIDARRAGVVVRVSVYDVVSGRLVAGG